MRDLPSPTRQQLLELARSASHLAYCPYSKFHVGAAVLAGGRFFTGCNIENASYGLTICAERAAIFRAVAAGQRRVEAIAVTCPDALPDFAKAGRMPCGACRQVIVEFSGPDTVIIVDGVGNYSPSDLLPEGFQLKQTGDQDAVGEKQTVPRPRICIDIDNVIAGSDSLMREIIREQTGGRVNLAYEEVKHFDYRQCVDSLGQSLCRGDEERGTPDEWLVTHNVFSRRVGELMPYPGIQRTLSRLSERFELHFATSRLSMARTATSQWLADHEFPDDIRLHFLQRGEKHLSLGHFFASVEDDLEQAMAFAHAGVHSFVLAHPWNTLDADDDLRSVFVHRFQSWDEIGPALIHLAGFEEESVRES